MEQLCKKEPQPIDMDILMKMEDEHLRLQRQVRIIQADRSHSIAGVHPQFRRQDYLLKTLKKEYINLIKDLKIARSGAHKKKDKKMKSDLKKALLYRMKTESDCEGGLTLMEQLNELLQRNSKYMLNLKNLVNTNKGQLEERRERSMVRLASAENRLEVAKLRFNCVQWENKQIREKIDHMLRDRANFNQAWLKMLSVLGKGKKFLTDLFESSTLAYDQRDEWCTKLKSLQEKGRMDQMLQVQEMRDLQKAVDHEMKLFSFLAVKGVMRINEKEEKREERRKQDEERLIKEEYDYHVKLLEDINNYTKVSSTQKIIEDFRRTEHENFSVYKLLTEFCAENVVLSRDIQSIRRDIVDRKDFNEMIIEKLENNLYTLKKRYEEQSTRTEELRRKIEDKDKTIERTMENIEEIFKMLKCSLDPYQNLLGDKQPSTRQLNLTFCLITDKIKEYLERVCYYERCTHKKSDKTSRLKRFTVHPELPMCLPEIPINILVPADPCPACVEARWMSRVTDTPETPFNKEMSLKALSELIEDPAYERIDRVHPLTECRVPRSRLILARRYMRAD